MSTHPFLPAVVAALLAAAAPASAKCVDEVHALAESHGINSKPPVVTPDSKESPPVTTRDLGRSGGVIAPPQAGDNGSVIKPPGNADPGMPTMPGAKPAPSDRGATPAPGIGSDTAKKGANRTALQAALTAARSAAERGDEKACEESLAKARQLAERP